MARLADALKVRLVIEEALIAAVLVDELARTDDVVDYCAERDDESISRRTPISLSAHHAERVARQNCPANRSPDLCLV